MLELANVALLEVVKLAQMDDPLWMNSDIAGIQVLNIEEYGKVFQKSEHEMMISSYARIESSKDSALISINAMVLIDVFMDSCKWVQMFSTIVARARTIEVLESGVDGCRSGSLVLMYQELQVLSPFVHPRKLCFLRYCQQIERGLWAIADVSIDYLISCQSSLTGLRMLPSGCLIQDMPNGSSKITWVQHMEIKEDKSTDLLFRNLICSGIAFGAPTWLTTLERMSERSDCLMIGKSTEQGGSVEVDKISMMTLAQRMVNSLCSNIASIEEHTWTKLSVSEDVHVRISLHKNAESGMSSETIINAATSVWLPVEANRLFYFLKDENKRNQWDVLLNGGDVGVVAQIRTGQNPGNYVSLLSGPNTSQNMMILQESCIDTSASMVVYSPIDLPSFEVIMNGKDTSHLQLLPSGFVIFSDGRHPSADGASSSKLMPGLSGSVLTMAFQIVVNSSRESKLSIEAVAAVDNLFSTTLRHIKAAMNCADI